MKKVLSRFNCLLCDLALSYVFCYFFLHVKPGGLPNFSSYFLIVSIYFTACYIALKNSVFQYVFRWRIQDNSFRYILVKVIFIGIIPFILTYMHSIVILTLFFLLLIIASLIIGLWKKKSLWQLLTRAVINRTEKVPYRKYYITGVLVCVLISIFIQTIKEYGFFVKEGAWLSNSRISMPISFPAKQKYINAIEEHKQDPIEYIFRLFEENDIVVLSERLHPEYTQWQFFSQIIFNDRFATTVGNVFTEIGNAYLQEELDEYMNTKFNSEEELKKATARIVRDGGTWPLWSNKNIYDFVLNLHEYNSEKDSSHKVNLFFSDLTANWQHIHNKEQWDSARYSNRDNIMANTIIAKYNDLLHNQAPKKKMLVIMNSRHAFKGFVMPRQPNVADYLSLHLPSKMANVLINGATQLFLPIKCGLWDEVALEIKNSTWAIDFNECAIGNAFFDLFPMLFTKNLSYKEIFNGMIYYQHPKDWRLIVGYDYILDNYRDTLSRRCLIAGLEDISDKEITTYEWSPPLIKIFNIAFLSLHYLLSLFLLINLGALFIVCKVKP